MGRILVGIGGWTFAPWRGVFYPADLPQKQELHYASRRVTSIEINGTFYGAQKPESFRRWASEAPEGFIFALKGPRFATHRRELGEAGASVERFVASGIAELGDKLGPILWQLPPTARFDEGRLAAFLELLPDAAGGRKLRHVLEARHESFDDPRCAALLRTRNVARVLVDAGEREVEPGEPTADFVYARLKRAQEDVATGYPEAALSRWAERARSWAERGDCFIYYINGAKVRAPAAAMAFLERLGR